MTDPGNTQTSSLPEFKAGGEAEGESFFGRRVELQRLSEVFQCHSSYSLYGPPKIGKHSLMSRAYQDCANKESMIFIKSNMAECENAFMFWHDFWTRVCQKAVDAGVFRDDAFIKQKEGFDRQKAELDKITSENSGGWYGRMRNPLKRCLKKIQEAGWRIVLCLEGFDAVTRVFDGNSAYYQFLRTLLYDKEYGLNCVILSRSPLAILEAKESGISTFSGIFQFLRLQEFDERGMEEFYAALRAHGIELNVEGRKCLRHHTGHLPYLCCLFADALVFEREQLLEENSPKQDQADPKQQRNAFPCLGEEDVKRVRRDKREDIWRYYDCLRHQLEKDGCLDTIVYLAFDNMRTVQYQQNKEDMLNRGYLVEEGTDIYAYSRDFMDYVRRMPLKHNVWELLSGSEKRLKYVFGKCYPKVAETHYRDFCKDSKKIDDIKQEYGLDIKHETVKQNAKKLSADYPNPSVLDVLALAWIVRAILDKWFKFQAYFGNDPVWKERLKLIAELRNPIAHANEGYISDEKLSKFNQYCKELISVINMEE